MTRLLVSIGLFLAATACGLPGAREQASLRACDFYERCNDIGSGKTYASRDDCMTKQRSNWVDTWPTDRCDGKLNAANLEVCLSALSATQCDNFIDLLATASKCGRDKVCAP